MHMIWLSSVIPGMLFVIWAFPATRRPWIWSLCLGIALLGIVAITGADLAGYLSSGGTPANSFKRLIYTLILSRDIPVVALALGSMLNWLITKFLSRATSQAEAHTAPTLEPHGNA